ncbi:hypothetical protein GCM10027577_48200 [Spirosoma fluminis]
MRPLPSGRLAAVTSETFAYSETIVTWTVPAGVTSLTIEARGAEGGTSPKSVYAPGKGAIITGKATVTPGQQLSILVGGQYIALPSGGGGSFVVTGSNPIQPLIVAGGGGGSGGAAGNTINLDSESKHGQLTNNGGAGTAPNNGGGAGGTGGNGGSIAGLEDPAAGGGGLFTNGQNAPQYQVSGGRAFVNGGAGGLFGAAGFGGGGLGYYQTTGFLAAVGGGGGGYSGGGSAGIIYDIGSGVGGGGGSFSIDPNGTATTGAQDGNSGNGLVIISYVQTLPIRYVKQDGTGDGSSWQQASGDLQAMIDAEGVQEVWVAQGLYKPTTGTDRSISFVMKAGVKVIGGFVGTEGQLGDRPTITPITGQPSNSILSGDLNGDDGPNFANTSDNSYHIIRNDGNRLDNTAVLDGFVISGGNANGNGNIDTRGGAIYNLGSNPSLINCSLQNNSAAINGGAIYNVNGNLGLINCSFQNNTASNGGAIYNNVSSPSLVNCSLQNNSATSNGGAIYNNISSPSLVNCSLQGNTATIDGGAIYNRDNSNTNLINSVFFGNGGANTFVLTGVGSLSASYSVFEPSVSGYTDAGNNLTTTLTPFVSTTSTQLRDCSPAINTGSNAAYSSANGPSTDLAGATRQYNGGVIDRGAYKYQGTPTSLTVSNPAISTATVGQPFSQSFTAQGGSGSYSYSVVSANLPSSLSLSASGVLSGTPTQAGSYSVLVSAQDASGCVGVASSAYTLTITDATPILTGFAASLNVVCVGSPVTFTATVGNVTGLYTYTLSNGSSTPTSGTANGNFSQNVTASGPGTQSFTLTVSRNGQVASAVTSLTVNTPPSLSLTSSGPLSFTNASVTLTATAGFASYVFSSGAAQQGGSSGNTARVSTVGIYSVTATTSGGCSVTASTTVTGGSSSLTVCRGGTAVISVAVSGSPVKYEWYKNSLTTPKIMESPQLFRGTATSSLTIINAQTNTQGDFYLKTTDGAGTVTIYGPYRLYVDASCRARVGAEVAIAESALEVSVLGNPLVNGQLRAVVKGAAGQPLTVKLINAQGYSLRQQDWKSAAQEQTVEWDMSNQAAGVYMLYVHTAGQTRQLKVVKL